LEAYGATPGTEGVVSLPAACKPIKLYEVWAAGPGDGLDLVAGTPEAGAKFVAVGFDKLVKMKNRALKVLHKSRIN
jgi:hypothetical protein